MFGMIIAFVFLAGVGYLLLSVFDFVIAVVAYIWRS